MMEFDQRIEIKGVRLNYDHIEIITKWIEENDMIADYSAERIDGEFENFYTPEALIKSKGNKPKLIVLSGDDDTRKIQVCVHLQYCIINTINIDEMLLDKIVTLLKKSVPRLFKIFPFIWFARITTVMFFGAILVFFIFKMDYQFLITYTAFPALAFFLVGIYNNNVNKINLIRSHETSSIWSRKKDDLLLLLISALIITPISMAFWEYLIKPFIDKYY